jgi:mannose-6-phosphate isomerase
MDVYPYLLTPLYKQKIWGGRNLERLYGKPLPAATPIGESWELADLVEGECGIANGPRAGQSLRQVVAEAGRDLMGKTPLLGNGRFPLLLKLLDAVENLSVQVHPDDEAAKAIPGAALKTECWYVLASEGGSIYKGVKEGVTADSFRRALAEDDVSNLLMRFDVGPGDFHYLPAGTVHALGAGVVVAEVQTPSDTTYRVSDWGRGREIHVERAMQCIHFEPPADQIPGAEGECLLKTDYFHVYLRSQESNATAIEPGRCTARMMLAGCGAVTSDSTDLRVAIRAGDTLLLPASLGAAQWEVTEPATWMEVILPPF